MVWTHAEKNPADGLVASWGRGHDGYPRPRVWQKRVVLYENGAEGRDYPRMQ